MPRHDRKAYETLTARIPQDLVEAARRYASLHHCTVSDLLRDSLQRYLNAESAGPIGTSEAKVLQGQTEVIQEVLRKVLQGQTEVIQEVRRLHSALGEASAVHPLYGQTEVRREGGSPAVVSAEVVQGQTTGAATNGQTEVRPREPLPAFDPGRYRLGKLCPRGHDWQGTGQSLRVKNKAGYCLACNAAASRARRQAQPPP